MNALNHESNHPNYVPGRGVIDEASARAEFDMKMSGEGPISPEEMKRLEDESREMSKRNNQRGRIKAKLGGLAASIVSGGTVRH